MVARVQGTGEMHIPALSHQSVRRNRHSSHAVHPTPWQPPRKGQRKLGFGLDVLKRPLPTYSMQQSAPLEHLLLSSDYKGNLENWLRCRHPGFRSTKPAWGIPPSLQHHNLKLSAHLDKTDNYARAVPQYPQTLSLCTAKSILTKLQLLPATFNFTLCVYIYIYYTHTLVYIYELNKEMKSFFSSSAERKRELLQPTWQNSAG